jgi:hypothetical protein
MEMKAMGSFKDIIKEYDKQETEKKEQQKQNEARKRADAEKNIKLWNEFIQTTIKPLLLEAQNDLKEYSYITDIIEHSPKREGEKIINLGSIVFDVELAKRSEVTVPYKASIVFSNTTDNLITVTKIMKNKSFGETAKISYSDGQEVVKLVTSDFLKKVYS